jgi:hypothetical protein
LLHNLEFLLQGGEGGGLAFVFLDGDVVSLQILGQFDSVSGGEYSAW